MKRTIVAALLLTACAITLAALFPGPQMGQAMQSPAVSPDGEPSPTPETAAPETEDAPLPLTGGDNATLLKVWSEGALEEVTAADYLPGVVAGEMPANFQDEALRAQAVAARTYILYQREHGCASHPEADVCDDPACCKAWLSEAALRERWGEDYDANMAKISAAVTNTDGLYLTYGGEPIQAVFHSSSAGRTESSANIWSELPYLVSVDSPESGEDVPDYVTEVEVSADALREAVTTVHPAADFSGEPADWLGGVYYNDTGRVAYASLGGAAVSGTELREMFSLRSASFTLEYTGESFLFTVTGYGHGVGMSQYGANTLAEQGADFQVILEHYYPGTKLSSLADITGTDTQSK